MKRCVLVFAVAAVLASGSETTCCRADTMSYQAWGKITVTIAEFWSTEGELSAKPSDLILQGEAAVDDMGTTTATTGSGSASTATTAAVLADDSLDLQLHDGVELFASVSGQAGPESGSSYASAFTTGSIYLDNSAGQCAYDVCFNLSWEYSALDAESVELLAGDFYTPDLFVCFLPDGDLPLADSGMVSLRLSVEQGGFNQLVIGSYAQGQADVTPVPAPGAALLGVFGMSVAVWKLRRDSR